jgi:hypothetical protein
MNPIQSLIQQLSEPKLQYVPGSDTPIHKPPTALELRAAKALYEAYKQKLPHVEIVNDEEPIQPTA